MIRRGDDDGVEIGAVQEFAVVAVLFGFGKLRRRAVEPIGIDVAQGDDVLIGNIRQIVGSLGSHADDADIQAFVGRGAVWFRGWFFGAKRAATGDANPGEARGSGAA